MTTTTRVLRTIKKMTLTFSGLAASASLLADSTGATRFNLDDFPNWKRITIHTNVDAIAATSVTSITFAMLTSCKGGASGATTDLAAVKADGSTAIAINHTATGVKGTGTGKIASTGATATTIGAGFSILATPDASVTSATGSVDIYIEGE